MGFEDLFDKLVDIAPKDSPSRSFDQRYLADCWNMGKELEDYAEKKGEDELDKALSEFKDQFDVDLVVTRRFYNNTRFALHLKVEAFTSLNG